jgi:ABC-type transport system involved in multi-copper enzyme maturation permease subunit
MTFTALLVKELRLRLRRERFVWVIIVYLLIMSLIGFTYLGRASAFSGNQVYLLSQVGGYLYDLLAVMQLLLIVFIAPAFTATTINGEKERQTFDLLLCSRLSSFSLLAGKLVAGLANALILIAASLPLFSLVFFFGGVAPNQVLYAVDVFVVTAITVGTFGLFCSTIVNRPAISTVIAYLFSVLWIFAPWVAVLFGVGPFFFYGGSGPVPQQWLAWNPLAALIGTLPGGQWIGTFSLHGRSFDYWIVFTAVSLVATVVFFLLSTWFVKPNPMNRLRQHFKKREQQKVTATANV